MLIAIEFDDFFSDFRRRSESARLDEFPIDSKKLLRAEEEEHLGTLEILVGRQL